MKKGLVIILLLASLGTTAQLDFQTIVTSGPVVVGESFQVQYVLDDTDADNEFFAPDFNGFRVVSGPNIYTGSAFGASGPRKLKNIVYTLAATATGKFIIPGASIRIENRLYKSNQAWIQVISPAQAAAKMRKQQAVKINEDVFLGPGENPYDKIRRNLFIKVLVDKTSCFVGEPVTAIFKLYSRLDSRSDIVKNPGFYGFTVQDMINLDNRKSTTEQVDGKDFDVHIVRKVQLYPLQAGRFEIDAMEVKNKVRFSKSAVSRQVEQEIIEGVIPERDEYRDPNTAVFENSMSTRPVNITVKPVPEKNKPEDYDGATGNFKITASLNKNQLARNEEGEIVISITGKGNFTQLSPPVIQWPRGIEGFEPFVEDAIDHMQIPMSGKREFHYRFVSSRAGNYILPAVSLSFFNPDTNVYRNVHTSPIELAVTSLENPRVLTGETNNANPAQGIRFWPWLALGIALIAGMTFIFYFKKNKNRQLASEVFEPTPNTLPTVGEILQPAVAFSQADERTFYAILRDCIWKFFGQRLNISGSQINKYSLATTLQQMGVDENSRSSIISILSVCETGIFTEVEGMGDKEEILRQAKAALEKMDAQLNA